MVIGLHGKAGSGKDTAYRFIQEWAQSERRPARRDAFADRLKVSAARALGYSGTPEECIAFCNKLKQPDWQIIVSDGNAGGRAITGRQYLQRYGTEAHREVFGQDFWTNAVLTKYDPYGDELLVITDVRFSNEAWAIKNRGGVIWHIRRPGGSGSGDSHISEQALPASLINHVIVNDRGIDHFRDLVLSQLERTVSTLIKD